MTTNWRNVVKKEYDELKIERVEQVHEYWKKNFTFVSNGTKELPCAIFWSVKTDGSSKLKEGKTISVTFYDKSSETKKEFKSFILTEIIAPPVMNLWVPIPRNFVSNDVCQVNDRNENNLITGKNFGKSQIMDDELFVKLVRALIPYENSTQGMMQSSTAQKPSSDSIIFPKISSYFEKNYSYEKYLKLEKRIFKSKPNAPNIDNPHHRLSKIQLPDQSLHSYRKLFCRRCFIYNCELHSYQKNGTVKLPNNNFPGLKPFSEPCSNTCYLMEGKAQNKENVSTIAVNSLSTAEVTNFLSDWTFADKALFLMLLKVFPENCCVIAKTMLTKSCVQVRKQMQSFGTKLSDGKLDIRKKEPKIKTYNKLKHLEKNYTPCDHEGSCMKAANCLCMNCEKFCGCGVDCRKRIPTCSCKVSCVSYKCICYDGQRECDPDNCECVSCSNVAIQRKLGKKLEIVPSKIHGWGIIIKELCQKFEYITEYRGELISPEEANRRGKAYDENNLTYLFQLNQDYVVDAMYFGSKIRFANFSKNPNCFARVMMVNGDHRIGIYAARLIEAEEELTIDYHSYDPTKHKNG